MNTLLEELKAEASKYGLTVHGTEHGHSNGHYKVFGGAVVVNYYPDSKRRTAHIEGTRKGVPNCTPANAVAMALAHPAAEFMQPLHGLKRPMPREDASNITAGSLPWSHE